MAKTTDMNNINEIQRYEWYAEHLSRAFTVFLDRMMVPEQERPVWRTRFAESLRGSVFNLPRTH